jgi:predicted 3-demethylubiquinone-9 3-methyltransferase (glyoxalase superfamily)
MLYEDPIKPGKVIQAMLKMQKIIIADLEAAYNS